MNDSGASNAAEYWVHSGTGRANARIEGYGQRGLHSNLYFGSNFQGMPAPDGDAYTIAHEHAHQAYGIYDSYVGPAGAAENAPASAESATLNYTLMDNYFTRGGNGPMGSGVYTLNEFSVSSNHDPDNDTFQSSVRGESDWETLSKSKFPATAPTGLPVSAAPGAHTVTFENAVGDLRAMLVVDRSGSMSIDNRLMFAQQGVELFADILATTDSIGLASFSSNAGVNTALAEASPTHKNNVVGAVNTLTASGATNIGGGLLAGLGQLTSQSDRSCNELLVVLSDGDHNTGTNPTSVIPQLQDESVSVLSVAVGSGLSAGGLSTLQNLAMDTGGEFVSVENGFELQAEFARLAAEATGQGILAQSPAFDLTNGQATTESIFVDSSLSAFTIVVSRAVSSDQFSIDIRNPQGLLVSPGGNVVVSQTDNTTMVEISEPDQGLWTVTVNANNVTDGRGEILAFGQGGLGTLSAGLVSESVMFPTPITVTATPQFEGEGVIGANVTAEVTSPDGMVSNITLLDDGSSGDIVAGDGVYTVDFANYSGDGSYVFTVRSETQENSAQTLAGESLFDELAPSNSQPVGSFVRFATTTALVNGVPDIREVPIDIVPYDAGNRVFFGGNLKIVAAFLSTPDFDATTEIDRSTIRFGATGTEAAPTLCYPMNANAADRIRDLSCLIRVADTGLDQNSSEGVFTAILTSGEQIIGRDSVNPQ